MGPSWTNDATLPGGDIDPLGVAAFMTEWEARCPWFPATGIVRLVRAYGTRIETILGDKISLAECGAHMDGDLYEAELDYLVTQEFVRTAEDVLWRRSKLGLHLDDAGRQAVHDWFAKQPVAA